MATRPNRELKIGEIIDKTFGVLSLSAVPVLIFIVVIAGMSAGIDIFAQDMTRQAQAGVAPSITMLAQTLALTLLVIIAAFVGSYLLVETMLKRTGLMSYTGDKRILAFVGMSLLGLLGVLGGFILVIIPGLIFMARWSVSGPLLIGRGEGVIASLGKSWHMTKGHELPIIVVTLIFIAVFYGLSYAPLFLLAEQNAASLLFTRLASTAYSAFGAAMGVAIFGILSSRDVSGTFS